MNDDFETDEYEDMCSACGEVHVFRREQRAIRETYHCPGCRASLRERCQASCILDVAAPGTPSLAAAIDSGVLADLRIYEPGTMGPFRRLFATLVGYQRSDYYPEDQRMNATEQLPHQDLQALTFEDSSFDLVITSDIVEHVRKPIEVFKQLHRVLVRGGHHVFTVPLQHPMRQKSRFRVDTSGPTDRPIEPEHYHGDGKGGRSLVYTDFGMDLVDMLAQTGFDAELVSPKTSSEIANRAITVVAKALPSEVL